MVGLYVLLNIAVLIAPLALSFDRRVAFFRRWPQVGVSVLIVSTVYIVWDIIVTRLGHWSFNESYSGVLRIAGLPLGEILFFITVPYACLFVYEVVRAYFTERVPANPDRARTVSIVVSVGLSAILVAFAVVYRHNGYSALALASVAVMLLLTSVLDREYWLSTHTLYFFLFSYLAFVIANGVLTGVPIVLYGEDAIWGVRVITIPLEDFFYNFAMLGFYLFFYRLAVRLTRRRQARA